MPFQLPVWVYRMTWYRKEDLTIFDHKPIDGFFYMDGEMYSRVIERDSTIGMKYPKIGFPSGRTYDIYQADENKLWVHLFADFSVPVFSNRETAFTHLKTLITPTDHIAYFVHPIDTDGILIWGKTEPEHLLITYNNDLQLITDVQGVSGNVGKYQVHGQTYYIP